MRQLLIGLLLVSGIACGGGESGGDDSNGPVNGPAGAGNAVVAVDLVTGNRVELGGDGPALLDPRLAVLGASNDILVWDAIWRALLRVDLTTGDRSVLADATTGSGVPLERVRTMALDATLNRVVLYDETVAQGLLIVAVDLTSGNRTVLADRFSGSGPRLDAPVCIALQTSSAAFVCDAATDAIFRVSLVGGGRSVVSDATTGTGPIWQSPGIIRHARGTDFLVLLDPIGLAEYGLDLNTGNRWVITDVGIETPAGFDFEPFSQQSYIAQHLPTSDYVLNVDLQTGVTNTLSSGARGAGPALAFPADAALDGATGILYVLNRAAP